MGDWGGSPDAPYTTDREIQTASGLNNVSTNLNASFVLALGDNFYDKGIPTDVNDQRFQSTFEDVYNGESLQGPDFFRVLAGNHDHYGNVTAEVAYTDVSERWRFDSLYYSFVEKYGEDEGMSVEFLMIDTVVLVGQNLLKDGREVRV